MKLKIFTEAIKKIALSSNDNKKNTINWCNTNILYGINKDLVCKKKDIKCNNIIKRHRNV